MVAGERSDPWRRLADCRAHSLTNADDRAPPQYLYHKRPKRIFCGIFGKGDFLAFVKVKFICAQYLYSSIITIVTVDQAAPTGPEVPRR